MKKIFFIICICILVTATGCSFTPNPDPLQESAYLNHDIEYNRPEDRDCLLVLDQILTAVDHKDQDALKEMFSKEALDQIEDIDEKLALFIETFPTWEKKYGTDFGGVGKHTNRGKTTRWVKGTFDIESGGREYVLYFIYYTDADEEPEKLGMSLLQIFENHTPGYDRSVSIQGEKSPLDIYLWDYTMDLADRKPLNKNTPFFVYEKSEEEKWQYLNTMDEEEVSQVILDKEDRERYYEEDLFSYEVNYFYVALHELRFAKEYMMEQGLEDKVVLEGPNVHYFDNSLLSDYGKDTVIFHFAEEESKKQYHMLLDIDGDDVMVVNEKELPLDLWK